MYKSKVFLVGDAQDELIELEEAGYMTESILQKYLVDYPDLLPGDQIDPENPRRWILVAQEMGISDGTNRWSLDHLFLDQDGIPTFVECKRATDTRARREVVAQMLDYAANGIEYWDTDRLRQVAAETAQRQGLSLDEQVSQFLGDDIQDIEAFWETVETNLRNRRVRLIFVADSTPKELRRLVEFLNDEMTNVEVLAVELKQFQGKGQKQKALVPRVVGLTESARSAKERSSRKRKRSITPDEFLSKCDQETRSFFARVLELAADRGHIIYWGEAGFSIRAQMPDGSLATFAYGYPPDLFQFYFGYTNLMPPGEESARLRQSNDLYS